MSRARCLAALLAVALSAAAASASDPLRRGFAPLADDCQKWLSGRKVPAVSIADITGPRTYPNSAALGARLALTELLRERRFEVRDGAPVAISVTYKAIELSDGRGRKRLAADMRVTFSDGRDSVVDDFVKRSDDEEFLHFLLGLTFDSGGRAGAAASESLVNSFFNPPAAPAPTSGTVALAGKQSDYGVEILVGGKPVAPTDRDGLAFAPVSRGQEYTVRLVNRSKYDAAVRLAIDGVSVFAFLDEKHPPTLADGRPNPRAGQSRFDMVLVPAGESFEVPGWAVSRMRVLGFKVTEFPDTAVAQRGGDASNTGTITATFSAAWPLGQNPPADEPPGTRGPGDDGTGFGKPKDVRATAVERKVGKVRAAVSVRYATAKE